MQILSFKLICLGFRVFQWRQMPGTRERELINRKIINELKNKPWEERHKQAEQLLFSPPGGTLISSRRTKSHHRLPVSNRVVIYFAGDWRSERHTGFARLGGAGHEMPALWFHQHRSARLALFILPPPRHACASEISTTSLISQQRLGHFWKGAEDYWFRQYLFVRY